MRLPLGANIFGELHRLTQLGSYLARATDDGHSLVFTPWQLRGSSGLLQQMVNQTGETLLAFRCLLRLYARE